MGVVRVSGKAAGVVMVTMFLLLLSSSLFGLKWQQFSVLKLLTFVDGWYLCLMFGI